MAGPAAADASLTFNDQHNSHSRFRWGGPDLYTKLWMAAALASELTQTTILADFVYFYIKAAAAGEGGLVRFSTDV